MCALLLINVVTTEHHVKFAGETSDGLTALNMWSCSVLWSRVDLRVDTKVWKEHTVSIFNARAGSHGITTQKSNVDKTYLFFRYQNGTCQRK
jgi:hypothetical protein